ncbi:MAG: hypothetical protein WB593_09280, partial [Candidatus Sulfotelmatobacter sp.]
PCAPADSSGKQKQATAPIESLVIAIQYKCREQALSLIDPAQFRPVNQLSLQLANNRRVRR